MKRLCHVAVLALCTLSLAEDLVPPGHRPEPAGVHALTGARVFVRPGEAIDNATIVIRDGMIVEVGAGVAVPAEARVWDMKGLTVYAGFIDAALALKGSKPAPDAPKGEADDLRAGGRGFFGVPGGEKDPGAKGAGHPIALIAPERRMGRDYAPDAKTLEGLREAGLTAANIVPDGGIIRGTSALVLLTDADPNRVFVNADLFQCVALTLPRSRDEAATPFPDSLMGAIAAVRQTLLDARHHALDLEHFRKNPGRRAPDFNPSLDALQAPRTFLFESTSALMTGHCTAIARELKLDIVIVASGQEWRRPDVARETGVPMILPLRFPTLPAMPEEADWDAVSLDQLRAWDWAPEAAAVLRGQGLEVALTTSGLEAGAFRRNLRLAIDRGYAEADALAGLTTVPAKICGVSERLGTVEAGKVANLTVVEGSYFDPEARVHGVWIDGRFHAVQPGRKESTKPDEAKKAEAEKKKAELRAIEKKREARAPSADRLNLQRPRAVIIRNTTVWTCGPLGRQEGIDILFADGKVNAIAKGMILDGALAADCVEIDGRGLHVTPGLIDCHNHSMILGDVNEGTVPSSAMVRIGDVVNSETDRIHEQLAGGLTIASLLHGSANPIGGQNCVIKLRDGATPEGLVFREAPAGIKFALGENVKQSNWGEKFTSRFPQSRMGVRAFFENRFVAARRYLEELKKADGPPVRRDLELEALGEILEGKRLIHCHSYRADEILMLIRLMDDFHVKIGTFQHVLEGYKVADEIAKHGAGGSCFSDWWAYKFEVYDAIPHAGSLMAERGVVTSFNSDSADTARRLNTEAAKAVKYGGTSEEEALRFVTLNPARQLGIADRVGSLEVGKDADFAIWTHSPLDAATVCRETWIEGTKYFDRAHAAQRAAARRTERAAILAKARKVAELGGAGAPGKDGGGRFFETALEHAHDGSCDVHCLGEAGHGEERR